MSQSLVLEIEMPQMLERFSLPVGVNQRLQELLDRQDQGLGLTDNEQAEAVGLVELTELLSLLKLRAQRRWREQEQTT